MPVGKLDPSQSTADSAPEQAPKALVPLTHAKVDSETREEITGALEAFGFDPVVDGFRLVMKAFARSPAVRDAVRDSLHLALLDAPKPEASR